MNIALWILQALLALHTLTGAVWKFSNSEQSVPSLAAIPHAVWLGLSGLELLCAAGLVVPALFRSLGLLVVFSAAVIALEMGAFSLIHFASGGKEHGQVIYWTVVAALSLFIAYGRASLSPL